MSRRLLVVTNDFPPRHGGIETFVSELVARLPPDDVVVFTKRERGDLAYDAALRFPVVRHRTGLIVPEPSVIRAAAAVARAHGCRAVWFGAAAPNALMTPALRRAGVARAVATTHGHEVWWSAAPPTRQLVHRIGEVTDVLTYLGRYTRDRIGAALGPAARSRMQQLTPGVDDAMYRPGAGGAQVRAQHGLGERPVIVCVSRLVPRKGQDQLIRALPEVRRRVPGAVLLIVGDGPYRTSLQRLAAAEGVADDVVFTGRVPWEQLPAHYDAGDVFAMPCRSRRAGLEVEGLGIVYLEASATGLPVIAGDSGGAPDAVLDGETGFVVGGHDLAALTDRLVQLLTDRDLAARMGRRGRAWVAEKWRWEHQAARLLALLGEGPAA